MYADELKNATVVSKERRRSFFSLVKSVWILNRTLFLILEITLTPINCKSIMNS